MLLSSAVWLTDTYISTEIETNVNALFYTHVALNVCFECFFLEVSLYLNLLLTYLT